MLITAVIVAMDQLTKWLVMQCLEKGTSYIVVPVLFNLVHWTNTGAAWGILQEHNIFLAVFSVIFILGLYLFHHPFQPNRSLGRVAFGLIAGGVVGNLIDRIRLGYVVDFLDFHVGRHHWPAFNVADAAICLGVALYVLGSWRAEKETVKTKQVESPTRD